jgi:hypothetical protein
MKTCAKRTLRHEGLRCLIWLNHQRQLRSVSRSAQVVEVREVKRSILRCELTIIKMANAPYELDHIGVGQHKVGAERGFASI